MKALRRVALTLALAFLTSRPSLAQIDFEVHVFGGGVFTVTDLAAEFVVITDPGTGTGVSFESALMEDGFTFGGGLGARLGQLEVEGEVMYWPSTQVVVLDLAGAQIPGVETSFRASSNVMVAGGNILYHFTVSEDIAIEPYVTGGAGIKRYNTDQPLAGLLFVEGTNVMWNVGIGAKFPISASSQLRVDVRDYMSTFDFGIEGADSKLQHDVISKVGISFVFGG